MSTAYEAFVAASERYERRVQQAKMKDTSPPWASMEARRQESDEVRRLFGVWLEEQPVSELAPVRHPDLEWVWVCCLRCRMVRRSVVWMAERGLCDHGDMPKERYGKPVTNEAVHGTLAAYAKQHGLKVPRGPRPKPVEDPEEENPWLLTA